MHPEHTSDSAATMAKRASLLALARKRQTSCPADFKGIGDYHGGIYECDYVSPYTKSVGNVDAAIMVVLQDWSSDERMKGPVNEEVVRLGHTPSLPTNVNLARLMKRAFRVELVTIYATNLFPFIKRGALNASIPRRELVRAATEFTIPEIRIVRPKLVICLGVSCFNAIRSAVQLPRCAKLETALVASFELGGARVWCQAHTGGLGTANRNRGGVDRVFQDWKEMASSVDLGSAGR